MLTLSAFISKYDGKSVDYDGYYGAQCVDLVRVWVANIGGRQFPPLANGAKDAYKLADAKYWLKVPRSSTNYPPSGAVVVFNSRPGAQFGHIAIARSGSTKTKLYSFDQNWSRYHRCAKETHDYETDRVIGWLINKTTTQYDPALQAKFESRTRNLFISKYGKNPEDSPDFFEKFQANFLNTQEGQQYVGKVKV